MKRYMSCQQTSPWSMESASYIKCKEQSLAVLLYCSYEVGGRLSNGHAHSAMLLFCQFILRVLPCIYPAPPVVFRNNMASAGSRTVTLHSTKS